MREFAVAVYQLTGEPILITPEANNGKREILATSNMDVTEGIQCLVVYDRYRNRQIRYADIHADYLILSDLL